MRLGIVVALIGILQIVISVNLLASTQNRLAELIAEGEPGRGITRSLSSPELGQLAAYNTAQKSKALTKAELLKQIAITQKRFQNIPINFEEVRGFYKKKRLADPSVVVLLEELDEIMANKEVQEPKGPAFSQIFSKDMFIYLLHMLSPLDIITITRTSKADSDFISRHGKEIWGRVLPDAYQVTQKGYSDAMQSLYQLTQHKGRTVPYPNFYEDYPQWKPVWTNYKQHMMDGHKLVLKDGYKVRCAIPNCLDCSAYTVTPKKLMAKAVEGGMTDIQLILDNCGTCREGTVGQLAMLLTVHKAWELPYMMRLALDHNIPQIRSWTKEQQAEIRALIPKPRNTIRPIIKLEEVGTYPLQIINLNSIGHPYVDCRCSSFEAYGLRITTPRIFTLTEAMLGEAVEVMLIDENEVLEFD